MVYVFLAQGFEEIEALTVVDILRRAGLALRTVGISGREIKGSHGIPVIADITEREVELDGLEMVVLPGGPGTPRLAESQVVKKAVLHAAAKGLLIGAICAAPSILGQWGLLKGKKAVCFPGYEAQLEGAQVMDVPVCEDGRIITANGAGAALPFALKLASRLAGEEKAAEVAQRIQLHAF